MDHGTLTDNNGRQADFRNVIIIMTTNAGAEIDAEIGHRLSANARWAMRWRRSSACSRRSSATVWMPRSRSGPRFDIIIPGGGQVPDAAEAQLHEKKVEAHFTDKLKTWLGQKGFDPLMGARPMAR